MQNSQSPRVGWTAWLRSGAERCAGWFVLVVVLLLLEGPAGTWAEVKSHSADLLHTFVGSNRNEITVVAIKTLPLVLATATMTFLFLRRWIPEGMAGIYLTAIVILITGWLARELSAAAQGRFVAGTSSSIVGHTDSSPLSRLLPDDLPGVLGLVAQGARQLSDYVWEYGLNLSAAAVVVGTFVGWKLHRRLETVQKGVDTVRSHWKRAA